MPPPPQLFHVQQGAPEADALDINYYYYYYYRCQDLSDTITTIAGAL